MKGKFLHSKSGERTRQVLVIIQYTASMILLCGTLIVFAQLNFMRSQSLGVKTDQTLVIKFPGRTDGLNVKLEAMKKAIMRLPLVHSVCSFRCCAGRGGGYFPFQSPYNGRFEAEPAL